MMNAAQLKVDGHEISTAEIWVHFKSRPNPGATRFSLLVRGEYIADVFDEWRAKPADIAWEKYILQNLNKSGTMAFDYYLRVLKRIDGIKNETPKWVVTSVDGIKAVDRGLLFEGTAEECLFSQAPKLKLIQ
jgi:hypothetical protein